MSLTDDGAIAIASAIIGDGGVTLFNEANAALGVGDNNTAFDVSQTTLEAESSSSGGQALRKGMDSGYPLRDPDSDGSTDKVRFKSTFTTSEANFHWYEWGVFNNTTDGGGDMLLRVVEDLGTKTSGDSWILQVDITVASE